MKEVVGDIWDYHRNGYTICVTTNGTVTQHGKAIMGAGIAKVCKQRYPNIPKLLGTRLKNGGNRIYHLSFGTPNCLGTIYSFPTKEHWYEDAKLDLIIKSAKELQEIVNYGDERVPIILPRPGCGFGRLDWDTQVKPAIKDLLSDDVWVITDRLTNGKRFDQ
jgi:hypothetical protein